ncbi:unnamed protein product [Paramecium primaurelia]|uniref:Ion transport domain-containing protein n=1 Tax=Paramecium primaurelia TaxID=5886 RepID=A0A8S1KX02_PARPR|nr:unnamed protein product [Paramecium primaurelia]
MSSTYKKLGIEFKPFTKDQISDSIAQIQSMRLEQILVGESEQFDWNNLLQKPELVDCVNLEQIQPDLDENKQVGQFSAKKTLFLFKIDDPFRRSVTSFLSNKALSNFIIVITILNIVAYSIPQSNVSIGIEVICNIFFGIEIILRVISQGLIFEENTYLRDKWNCIHFISFIFGWIILIDYDHIVLTILKTIRLLRVIRLSEEISPLKIQLEAYISSFSKLGIVIVPFIFFLLYFSVIGLHFFMGLTTMRCRLTPEPEDGIWEASEEVPYLCGIYECPEHLTCGSPYQYGLEWDHKENDSEEFMWNFLRFDNLPNSLLVIFTYFCLIGWSETNYMFWKAMTTYFTAGFFLLVLVFLAFIFSNLLLATFYESFIVKSSIKNSHQKVKKQQQQIETEINQKKQQQMTDRLALMSKKRKSMKQEQIQNSNFTLFFQDHQQNGFKKGISLTNISNELSQSIYFAFINNLIIILCTLSIVIDYDGLDQTMLIKLQIIEFVCTLYFYFELLIFFFAKGIKNYFKKPINYLDFIAIISQLILFCILYILDENVIINQNRIIQVFKAIKLIRIIKFSYSAKIFYHISILTRAAIQTIAKLKSIISLWIIFAIFIALVGNALLKQQLSDHETPIHYNDFSNSLMAAFSIFYNEEWHLTMYRYGRVTPISFIYHIISILLGQVIFIKLLSAVFLNEFTKQVKIQEQNVKPIEYKQAAIDLMTTFKQFTSSSQLRSTHQLTRGISNFPGNKSLIQNVRQGILRNLKLNKKITKIIVPQKSQLELDNLDFLKDQQLNTNKPQFNENENDELLHQPQAILQRSRDLSIQVDQNIVTSQQQIQTKVQVMKTLYVFNVDNQFRLHVQMIINSRIFKILGFIAVGLSAIRTMLVTPLLDPHSQLYISLDILYIIITSLYCLFIFLHIIAHGLYGNQNAFLTQSFYNVLNFIITVIEIVVVTTSIRNHVINFISSLRVFEFIKLGAEINHSIKYAQVALINALVKMVQLSIFCFILFLVYGTFAMKLLKGYNYYCTEVDQEEYQVHSNIDCMDYGGSWQKHRLGFDNILDSALTLFVIVTSEGWSPIMEQIWSIRGENQTPEENYNRYWAIYFQVFFFIGNTCMLNMFIGLVVSTYDESKLKAEGTYELEGNQREWCDIKKSIHKLQPKVKSRKPKTFIRKIAFFLVKNQFLKKIYLVVIFINTLSLSLCYVNQGVQYKNSLEIINLVCILIFIFEIVSRFIAKEFKIYFKELINIIEIFGIWICLAEKIIDLNGIGEFYFLRCFKAFSVSIQMLRNFRIIKRFNRIERLFHSIFSVIPNALSMLYIMFVFLFIYTSLGIDMFCYLRPQKYIDDFDVHFRKFTTAMFSLVRVASSELWWELLVDALHTRSPDFACIEIDDYQDFLVYGYNGCGTNIAYVYFITFHLIFSLVLLNLFIASILGAYEEHAKQEQNAISKYQLNDVLSYWVEYDPYGSGFLNYKQFWRLSSQIAICFGVSGKDLLNPANKKNFLKALNIPLYEEKSGLMGYLFHDVIVSLTKISVELKYGVKDLEKKNQQENEFNHDYYSQFVKTPYNSGQMTAIIYLQNKARTLINKKRGINFLNIEALRQELQQQAENQ